MSTDTDNYKAELKKIKSHCKEIEGLFDELVDVINVDPDDDEQVDQTEYYLSRVSDELEIIFSKIEGMIGEESK